MRWWRCATLSAACHVGALAGTRGAQRRSQGGAVFAQPVGARRFWSVVQRVAGQVASAGVPVGREQGEEEDGFRGEMVNRGKF